MKNDNDTITITRQEYAHKALDAMAEYATNKIMTGNMSPDDIVHFGMAAAAVVHLIEDSLFGEAEKSDK